MNINRKQFLFRSSGLLVTAWLAPKSNWLFKNKMDRIGMGTVLFRNSFSSTKPDEIDQIEHKLTLLNVPEFYRDRFNINKLEFWSYHFESLERKYLERLKANINKSNSKLINVQLDGPVDYDLASTTESKRLQSVEHAKKWIDAVSFLGSEAIRINPGKTGGSVEKSIESMKEVNQYAKSKNLVLLTENHFGIEMDPDIHLEINKKAGPDNIYTLPDFGNYPKETMYESLDKILPHAYVISAKAATFNENLEHISYDFDRCVRMAEQHGFKGIYLVEQWSPGYQDFDFEKVADWIIERVKRNIS